MAFSVLLSFCLYFQRLNSHFSTPLSVFTFFFFLSMYGFILVVVVFLSIILSLAPFPLRPKTTGRHCHQNRWKGLTTMKSMKRQQPQFLCSHTPLFKWLRLRLILLRGAFTLLLENFYRLVGEGESHYSSSTICCICHLYDMTSYSNQTEQQNFH